ncbi:carbon monoxide dehydrogenase [Streptomyces sp. NBC_01281]|uniref:carbon monoxide dehydrogenase n=1 Tax=Streptomyces sp. NBC_01281 TaxID=2903811 RepID=UPI002E1391D0|nr:carbon monoxide dehydrogenase [Streptomyces sp. NBC_01281]
MEHEVFVPFPAGPLREALADPVRVARAVPGLQQDASAGPDAGQDPAGAAHPRPVRVAGRLKVRVAGHTITYRGALRLTAREDGAYAVDGDGTEVRGRGVVKLALTLRLAPAEGGTTLAYGGTASADGRLTELSEDSVAAAARRLLTRFTESLTAGLTAENEEPEARPRAGTEPRTAAGEPTPEREPGDATPAGTEGEPPAGARPASASATAPETDAAHGTGPEGAGTAPDPDAGTDAAERTEAADPGEGSGPSALFETEVPPSSLDPGAEDDDFGDFGGEAFAVEGEEPGAEDAMAEAAHARRTMIGRSAEEVDHAPPRGRYAPVPPPEATAARATLRWAAPAAAIAVASAIAVTRALRRRR